jgi:hypothetical protein
VRFITGEVADLDSPYQYWASEVRDGGWRAKTENIIYTWCIETFGVRGEEEGVWNWSYNHTRTGCYYFVKEQDMAFFLLKWNR